MGVHPRERSFTFARSLRSGEPFERSSDDLRSQWSAPASLKSDGMSAGAMAGIAFALLLFLGVMFWAFAGGDRQTATTTPPATTGQRAPAPAPAPAPERAPAPAPKAQ